MNFNLHICDALGFVQPEVMHERGQDNFCAGHEVRAIEDIWSHHRSPWRRCRCAGLELRRFVLRNGLCTIDLVRTLARHRGLPHRHSNQVVLHGNEGCFSTLDALRCAEPAGLAHSLPLAMRLVQRARILYAKYALNIYLDATVYALDATAIDLYLSLFDWASFHTAKAAVKMHTLPDLRRSIPAFIHISDGKMHEVNVLDILPLEVGVLRYLPLEIRSNQYYHVQE